MIKKILFRTVAGLVFIVGGAIGYLALRSPASAPPLDIKVEATPARLERGSYLYEHLMHCDGCHGENDFTRFAGPVIQGRNGAGFVFPKALGLPGNIAAPNITPDKETGIGSWTDGEKIRAIREGISKDGRALLPMMPYSAFRKMSDEDAYSLVAYLNSLPPVKNAISKSKIAFPVSLMIKSAPQPAGSVREPNRADRVKYGEYLTTLGGCIGCHTLEEHGQLAEGKHFAGGRMFNLGFARVVSANISQDEPTGIGRWSEKQFIEKFTQYRDYAIKGSPKIGNEDFTLMAWVNFSQLKDEDLSAIYAYLKLQPAVYNAVDSHPDKPKEKK
jgi:mono/diheme cytochrome c family protein